MTEKTEVPLTEAQRIEFLREFAKCGIYHNYMHDDIELQKLLKTMNEAIKSLQDLREQLKEERNKAIDECIVIMGNVGHHIPTFRKQLESLKSDSK